ncbi:hypothetical protein COY52_05890 [Candidatus Desantisbacteria bacterium CG_4_10_14_0_8_um_filter_48_22]|uniref:Uncharacterized protein n=1 Tax=Candidatus Desantisbacteria bacterium CG_4_10_14_0_8_um_filter_48_22 TaxID=1974543 RepID=A0A2M7SBL7_9BACT|nr:MAG: hypothetical protein AUJ67_08310 [Candidatus Desantisbacteria bacterium CG1_02_49_89]PIV55214.1 MAG: hypothetical protein COS16_07925 [Candidatus Desantisbacteria bacterium CG02_land_8_20_14_3_00_49_13]PIZ16860.1 MAG: hypothetical protein COY52_05890 [Candidatus Desantisbacteria bacterium CG_4_10_14_0_8_um_filter_48_22]
MDVSKEMKITGVIDENEKLTVATTGAKYVFLKTGEKGRILCYQLINIVNGERLNAVIIFPFSFLSLTLEKKGADYCVLHQGFSGEFFVRFQVNGDSVLDLYTPLELNIGFDIELSPAYSAEKDGNAIFIDDKGGFGIYPCRGYARSEKKVLDNGNIRMEYASGRPCRFLVSIFPPRKFQEERYYKENIAHFGVNPPWTFYPYPSDEMIEGVSAHANLLVLHAQIWQGKLQRNGIEPKSTPELLSNASFSSFDHVPVSEKELARVVRKCRSLKMKVIPYLSPTFSTAFGEDFLAQVRKMLDKYGMDGVYLDGFSFDLLYGYRLIRDIRRILGDRILYLHATCEPFWDARVWCPFIYAYADYSLRAEMQGDFDDNYLRYGISGYNTSNSIHYTCTCYYKPDFVRKILGKALEYRVKFYLALPQGEIEEILKSEYFPKLKQK